MKSMTGYGYSFYKCDDYILEIEIKGYNNRYLDIYHNINSIFNAFEAEIDRRIKSVCLRGKVEISIKLKELNSASIVTIDEGLLSEYLKALKRIKEISNDSISLYFRDFLSIENLITNIKESGAEEYKEVLFDTLDAALKQFDEAKRREGESTKRDLIALGKAFEESNNRIGECFSSFEEYYKSLLLSKYEELKIKDSMDENQFRQEVGNVLVRYSINEEQIRLKAHIKEYFRLLESDEAVGKRLDFLCQEMNRETNTSASKSQLAQINILTVSMKDNLENIREQIRNIE